MDNLNDKIELGVTINELTILSYCNKPEDTSKYEAYGGPWVHCQCSCGKEVVVPLYGVKNGFIKSCGHFKGQMGGENLKKYYEEHDSARAIYLTIDGETKNISEWSRITGIPRSTIVYRLKKEMPLNKVFDKELRDDTDGDQS